MDLQYKIHQIAVQAKAASLAVGSLDPDHKNELLAALASGINHAREAIKAANQLDLEQGQQQGLSPALLDRLLLDDKRINAMIKGIEKIAQQSDPVGTLLQEYQHPNGLIIQKRRVPIGVIAIIYESRPNVTADVAALCIKSGNAVILRGGREALNSNKAITDAMLTAAIAAGLPEHAVQLITETDREGVKHLVQMRGLIDLAIPRGGPQLIDAVTQSALIPVIKHDKGLCHTYVDKDADMAMALAIAENAKCQRPGVCNAMETLLVHQDIAPDFLPKMIAKFQQNRVEVRGCEQTLAIVKDIKAATEEDWDCEYLDKIIAIKVVADLATALQHIQQHGSQHSEAIISNNPAAQNRFCQQVDAACVYVNASTRFTDGSEFGLGAEMGISTDKLHARGPMGVDELTSYKYVITGQGQTR